MSDKITVASEYLAKQIASSLAGLDKHLALDEQIYAYALVVPDDFSSMMGYTNTEKHYAASEGKIRDRWYFGQWFSGGMDIDSNPIIDQLGDASSEDVRSDGPHTIQASWLVSMAEALRLLRTYGQLTFRSHAIVAFCSMIDCRAASWIEIETARDGTTPKTFAKIEPALRAANTEWYGVGKEEVSALRQAFDHARALRLPSR